MKVDKFLYIRDSSTEGMLLAQDGGIAIIWHNGEHLVGQCYRERLELDNLQIGIDHAFETMAENSSDSSMFDFEDEHEVLPLHIQEMADWLVCPRQGDFFDNLTIIDVDELTEEEIDSKVLEFIHNKKYFETLEMWERNKPV
jgi:hypothetical protein